MTATHTLASAKIYQFTPRRRDGSGLDGARGAAQVAILRPATVRAAPAICFDAWYHEAAMREDNAGRKG